MHMQTIWLWPNVDAGSDEISKGLRMFREKEKPDYVHFYRNFSVEHYAQLIGNCACLIGNSSSGIREGSFLGVPDVNIGTRQTSREQADNCINTDYNHQEIEDAIRHHIKNGRFPSDTLYGDGQAGDRIADILADVDINIQKKLMY
jgi:UDP-N-acetylglucosamine 2-epimerase